MSRLRRLDRVLDLLARRGHSQSYALALLLRQRVARESAYRRIVDAGGSLPELGRRLDELFATDYGTKRYLRRGEALYPYGVPTNTTGRQR